MIRLAVRPRPKAQIIICMIESENLSVEWIIETHVHADTICRAISQKETRWEDWYWIPHHRRSKSFRNLFNMENEFQSDGSQFDQLFTDGDTFRIGDLNVTAMHTPGHTPACMSYHTGDALFVGDTIFMPDSGTARDFRAAMREPSTRAFKDSSRYHRKRGCSYVMTTCQTVAKMQYQTTVAEQRAKNLHVHEGISENEFVSMRLAKDKTLNMPALILPSIQVNIRAGELPPAEDNGVRYLKIPIDAV